MSLKDKLQQQYQDNIDQITSRFEEMLEDVVGNAVDMNQPLNHIILTKEKMKEYSFNTNIQVERLLSGEGISFHKDGVANYILDLS